MGIEYGESVLRSRAGASHSMPLGDFLEDLSKRMADNTCAWSIAPLLFPFAVASMLTSFLDLQRFVIAEVIKNSELPLHRLLQVLQEGNVSPNWPQMLLPHGTLLSEQRRRIIWPSNCYGTDV